MTLEQRLHALTRLLAQPSLTGPDELLLRILLAGFGVHLPPRR